MFLPSSTYRVQLHKDFTLSDLRKNLDYLDKLGVHTIYAAPVLKAEPGSMHGYDVTDPHTINPEIGTLGDLRDIAAQLKTRGMAWIQDIVPNHMAFTVHNFRIMDVLERGSHSPYYNYFDINWNHPDPDLKGKLMVPFLGKPLEQCLSEKEIQLALSDSAITVNYFETAYPASEESIAFLCAHVLKPEHPLNNLRFDNSSSVSDWLRARDAFFTAMDKDDKVTLRKAIEALNQDGEGLKKFLDLQWYRLVYWKETEHRINYRRFFTVNSLICLRMEDPWVFDEYHQLIFKLYEEGLIQGVRIDHIDGLNNPSGYLRRLRKSLGADCYIIAEKILEPKEEMPEQWPLEGTSGYEFLYYANQLFTNRKGTGKLVEFYHSLIPGMPPYEEVVMLNKRLILNGHLAGELENVVEYFFELKLQSEFSRQRIKEALSLFMLSLSVYRIYPDKLPLKGDDLHTIREAIEKARTMNDGFDAELNYLLSLCLGQEEDISKQGIIRFLRRLMQFTGPLMAKGVEDTTFYIYNPLISHVEVGDAPSTLGITIQDYHKSMIRRQQTTPHALNATATHDTKRGEDARIRLNAISDHPDYWIELINSWIKENTTCKRTIQEKDVPIVNDEYFIYQSIVGGLPENNEMNEEWKTRLKEYMVKVVREAKVMSNWSDPNEDYEDACKSFIDCVANKDAFLASLKSFQSEILLLSEVYSISQAVLKITSPGIPDIYQGCELLDLSFVDPDNRRPVDYEKRRQFLDVMDSRPASSRDLHSWMAENSSLGIRKMYAIHRLLQYRRNHPEVFSEGIYLPLTLKGSGNLAVGYARHVGENWCLTVIPLGKAGKKKVDSNEYADIFISLPANSPRKWRNIFTDEPILIAQNEIRLEELLKAFPVAVLCND